MLDVWMRYTLPLVQLLGALVISSRIPWRSHPSLIAYLISQSLWYTFQAYGIRTVEWSMPIQCAVITAVAFEVATFARIRFTTEVRGRIVAGVLAACASLASLGTLTATQRVYLFRQYYLLALLLALCGLVIARLWHPMIECSRHRVYRIGMAASVAVLAGSSTFIRGGIGYKLFPYTMATWNAVNYASYGMMIVVVSWMALKMNPAWSKVPADVCRAIWLVVRDARREAVKGEMKGRMAA